MIQPWQTTRSELVADCRIFKVRRDRVVHPRSGETHDMFVLEQPNWVNVIPLTPANEVVLVRQWRHGTRTLELETPGGLIEGNETPEACGQRELLEETGYRPEAIVRIGQVRPNPAFQNNVLYYVLARDCRRVAEPVLDHAEDIEVELVALAKIPSLVRRGHLAHSLVIGAFYWLALYLRDIER